MTPAPRRYVSELMNPDVVCARPDMTLGDVARLLAARGVSGAPVVDEHGRVVGMITQNDIVRHAGRRVTVAEAGRFVTDVDDYRDLGGLPADLMETPAEKVMSQPIFAVSRDSSVAVAAHIMRERSVHRLPVTDRGRLVGMLSALDLMRVVEETC
jgi:CBS domain-containing protein